jgi:arabinose-5-phosphate isomerase
MCTDELPVLAPDDTMRRAVVVLAERRGTVIVVDADRVVGVFTAGDLTRLMEREDDFFAVPLRDVMVRHPKLARPEELGSAVVYRMERHGIMAMPVVDEAQALVGIVHLHDLMRAGAA